MVSESNMPFHTADCRFMFEKSIACWNIAVLFVFASSRIY
jgi:hypothetical protein